MKKFELSAYGVDEMNQKEMVATDGGFIGLILPYALQATLVACAISGIVAGFEQGRELAN